MQGNPFLSGPFTAVNLDLELPMKRQKRHAEKGLSLREVTAALQQKFSVLHL